MCREEANKLWQRQPELEALGVNLVCILKENLPGQLDEFKPKYWGGAVYQDTSLAFYKALYNGQLHKAGVTNLVTKASRRNQKRSSMHLDSLGGGQNFTGEGFVMGGLVVVRNGLVEYSFREENFGDHAPWTEVLAAAKAAVAAN